MRLSEKYDGDCWKNMVENVRVTMTEECDEKVGGI